MTELIGSAKDYIPSPWGWVNRSLWGPKARLVIQVSDKSPLHLADASLISAAPDLLEACEAFDRWYTAFVAWELDPDRHARDLADMSIVVRAAIGKAHGVKESK